MKKILLFFQPYKVTTTSDVDDNNDNWWWGAIMALLLCAAATFCPRSCHASTVPCDTIPIEWGQTTKIFEKASKSGKSNKFYIVFEYKGYKELTTISKSNVEYIQMCKQFGIIPNIALRVKKNGEVLNMVVIKKRRL